MHKQVKYNCAVHLLPCTSKATENCLINKEIAAKNSQDQNIQRISITKSSLRLLTTTSKCVKIERGKEAKKQRNLLLSFAISNYLTMRTVFYLSFFLFQIISSSFLEAAGTETVIPFLAEPNAEPYYVKELEAGPLLRCSIAKEFRNRGRYELEWIKIVGGLPITVSRNSDLFDKKYYNLEENIKNGEYNLRVKMVALAQDNGNFFCALIDLENRHRQFHSKPANIIVVVRPEEPQIVVQPSEAVREHQLVTLECASKGGNPPPRFAWVFDNNTEVPESWVQAHHNRGRSTSTLRWQVKSEDNGAFLTCQIWNEAMHQAEILSAETRRINVLYAPRVTVGPQSVLNVEDGDKIELNCQADANPKAEHVEWRHVSSGRTFSQAKWQFTASRHQSGEFRCIASNQLESGVAKLELNVLYAPILKIRQLDVGIDVTQTRIEPTEGQELILECEVDSLPIADQISWLSPSGAFLHNDSRLVIPQIQRTDIGNFTCLASNTLSALYSSSPASSTTKSSTIAQQIRTSQVSVYIDVRRRPGPSIVAVTDSVVVAGKRVALTCTTTDVGNPPAAYRWDTPHGYGEKAILESQELIIESAKMEDNGRYKCVAYNQIGQGKEATAKILVIEPAQISRQLPPKKAFVAGDADASIHCEARGFPAPKFEWLKDGVLIANANITTPTLTSDIIPMRARQHWIAKEQEIRNEHSCSSDPDEPCLRSVVGSLAFFDSIQWSDKGNYTCRAYNSIILASAVSAQSVTTITVTHEPVILNQRFDGNLALAAAEVGKNAQISCVVSANPTPTITWMREGRELDADNQPRYNTRSSKIYDRLDEFESILGLVNIVPADYGTYSCMARNGAGATKAVLDIRLQAKSAPQAPFGAQMLKSGATWLQVGWRAAFDGGEAQQFEVVYRVADAYAPHDEIIKFDGNEDSMSIFIFDSQNSTTVTLYGALENMNGGSGSAEVIQRRLRRYSLAGFSDLSMDVTYHVHNLTNLRPASAVWWRVRARNSLGVSEWTLMNMATTLDALQNDAILAPESIQYFFDEQKLVVQPYKSTVASILASKQNVNGKNKNITKKLLSPALCTLVYAGTNAAIGLLRSVNCFPHQQTLEAGLNNAIIVEGIQPAEKFRVRFCRRADLSICSTPADLLVDVSAMLSMTPSWELLAVVGVGVILCVAAFFVLLFCVRRILYPNEYGGGSSSTTTTVSVTSSQKKVIKNKRRLRLNENTSINKYDVGAPIPQRIGSEHKNTAVHGSQNDSGVFTLGSSMNAIAHNNATQLNQSTNSENWRHPCDSNHSSIDHLPYDFSNDPYLQEFHNLHGIVAMENGLAADELREPSRNGNQSQQSQVLHSAQQAASTAASSMLLRQSQAQMQARRSVSLSSNVAIGLNRIGGNINNAANDESNTSTACENDQAAKIHNGAAVVVSSSATISSSETLVVTTPSPSQTQQATLFYDAINSNDSNNNNNTSGSFNNEGCRVMREIIV